MNKTFQQTYLHSKQDPSKITYEFLKNKLQTPYRNYHEISVNVKADDKIKHIQYHKATQYSTNKPHLMSSESIKQSFYQIRNSKPSFFQENKSNKRADIKNMNKINTSINLDKITMKQIANSNNLQSTDRSYHLKNSEKNNKGNQTKEGKLQQTEVLQQKNSQTQDFKFESSQYKSIYDKLTHLQGKFNNMRLNLEKKRQDKRRFLQAQQKERLKHQEQKNIETRKPKHDTQHYHSSQNSNSIQQNHKNKVYNSHNSHYYLSQIIKLYKTKDSIAYKHLMDSLHILKCMKNTPRPTIKDLMIKNMNIRQNQYYKGKKTIVFDLDETLVHATDRLTDPYHKLITITFPDGQVIHSGISIRPYAIQLLKKLSKHFEIIIFTASRSAYANLVIDILDPQRKYVQYRLFRQHCYQTSKDTYVKDLRILNRNLSEIVLVDNSAYSFYFQLDNAIPILPYYEGSRDNQLVGLQKYLLKLESVQDVREMNRKTFKLDQYTYYENIQLMVKELYIES